MLKHARTTIVIATEIFSLKSYCQLMPGDLLNKAIAFVVTWLVWMHQRVYQNFLSLRGPFQHSHKKGRLPSYEYRSKRSNRCSFATMFGNDVSKWWPVVPVVRRAGVHNIMLMDPLDNRFYSEVLKKITSRPGCHKSNRKEMEDWFNNGPIHILRNH